MFVGTPHLPGSLISVLAAIWVIVVWSFVGIWRSANSNTRNVAEVVPTKSIFWAHAAKLTILIGILNLVLISILILGPEIH